jgi:triosephosphate isomerase (TIM)
MRNKVLAANWKMNFLKNEAFNLYSQINSLITNFDGKEIIVFPPSIFISELNAIGSIPLGIQNIYFENTGAFTGEISAVQAKSIGCSYVLIGHSERRQLFFENHLLLKKKVNSAIKNSLKIVFACGEAQEIRDTKKHLIYVKQQLKNSLFHLSDKEILNCIIAYEPIWAIGTGINATCDEAEEMHTFIRSVLAETYSEEISKQISIIYGGSCDTSNAVELFACSNVDGALIGGASLRSDSFIELAAALR